MHDSIQGLLYYTGLQSMEIIEDSKNYFGEEFCEKMLQQNFNIVPLCSSL